MELQYQDFIGIYKNVYPTGFCERIIELTEEAFKMGAGWTRLQAENLPGHIKHDTAMDGKQLKGTFNDTDIQKLYFDGLQACFKEYVNKYSTLDGLNLSSRDMKIQKTGPGEGYHVWHFEHGPNESANRSLVFILYLNTLKQENAGESEFLYQQKRITPSENTMIIWPASYTHTHRGNPVYGDAYKYIITGWFSVN